ncbi:MAG: hypothetical protein KJ626_09315 [Verrucomicrobia bacterium]|nr:hypothetical protein [Verrucomicrobiota bacterium]
MADINFDCPGCGQNLDAPDDMAGVEIECPVCGRGVTIPSPEVEQSDEGIREAPESLDQTKGSTVRIDVPPELLMPKPKPRIIKIKRMD